jgi:hypothetical protein
MDYNEAMIHLDAEDEIQGQMLGWIVMVICWKPSRQWTRTLDWFQTHILPKITMQTDFVYLENCVTCLYTRYQESEEEWEISFVLEAIRNRIQLTVEETIEENQFWEEWEEAWKSCNICG